MDKKIHTSIVIPVKNEEANIKNCIDSVFNQDYLYPFEIIIIDSGSTDGTLQIINSFKQTNIQLITISPDDFGHGKTRNLGFKKAKGEYVVFLNGDAIPQDTNWLLALYENFSKDSNIQAVFSKHIPNPDCHLYMWRDICDSFPDRKRTITMVGKYDQMFFSTVSCMILKTILEKFPFKEEIIIAEDQEWARRILNLKIGKIIYEPSSKVEHSHNYPPRTLYQLKKKVGFALNPFQTRFAAVSIGFLLCSAGFFFKTLKDLLFIILKKESGTHKKIREFFIALRARFYSFSGKYSGWISRDIQ